jgi:gas vesicle protein
MISTLSLLIGLVTAALIGFIAGWVARDRELR